LRAGNDAVGVGVARFDAQLLIWERALNGGNVRSNARNQSGALGVRFGSFIMRTE
jgi:hypothetical protein